MAKKTNAVRIVQQHGFNYSEAFYEYDDNDLSGMSAASKMNLPPEQVFKTLVTRGSKNGICVFCIPVCCELDLKLAAKASGDKSISMLPTKELLSTTGYIRGGCSPIGMKKLYPTFIDETCQLFDLIAVSAGERGHQILLSPEAIVSIAKARIVNIIT